MVGAAVFPCCRRAQGNGDPEDGPQTHEPRDLRYPHPSMQTNQVSQQNYHVALLSGMIIIAIVVVMEQMWCKQYSPRSDGPPGDEETPKPCLIHIRSNRESSRCKGLASEERSPGTPLSSSGHVTVSSGPGDGENLEGQQGSHCWSSEGPEEPVGAGDKAFSVI